LKQILVFGDSLSWGIIPNTRKRLSFEERWPGVLEKGLNDAGQSVRVLEDCLNGRRTVWEDPFKAGRNGQLGLAQRMEIHSPLSLVILMLGTNDLQFSYPFANAWSAAQGVLTLVNEIRRAPIEPGMPVPPVLVVCPPAVRSPKGTMIEKFAGADERCAGMAEAYRLMCANADCHFFDANAVVAVSEEDGVHLDAAGQIVLGKKLASVVGPILG
jgi:lysophospholipase L1-like esterase